MLRRGAIDDPSQPHYALHWYAPNESEPTTLALSVQGWRFIRIGLLIFAVLMVLMMVLWGVFLHRFFAYDRLVTENQTLQKSSETLEQLRVKLERMQILDSQIRRSFGNSSGITEEDRALLRDRFRTLELLGGNSSNAGPVDPSAVPTRFPVTGIPTRGYRQSPLGGIIGHRGVDFAAAAGTPILAAGTGRVLFSGWTQQYGNTLAIGHSSGTITLYGHAQALFRSAGDDVRQGDPIGLVGSTGISTAPHLHFEIWENDRTVDPFTYLKTERAAPAGRKR